MRPFCVSTKSAFEAGLPMIGQVLLPKVGTETTGAGILGAGAGPGDGVAGAGSSARATSGLAARATMARTERAGFFTRGLQESRGRRRTERVISRSKRAKEKRWRRSMRAERVRARSEEDARRLRRTILRASDASTATRMWTRTG